MIEHYMHASTVAVLRNCSFNEAVTIINNNHTLHHIDKNGDGVWLVSGM